MASGITEIYFAGEKSYKLYKQNLENEYFEISAKLYSDLNILSKGK